MWVSCVSCWYFYILTTVLIAQQLACSSKATGELHLYTTLQAPNPPAVGPDGILLGLDPVRDANNHPILQRYNEVYDKFSWYECDSKAMGYTVSDNLSFGCEFFSGRNRSQDELTGRYIDKFGRRRMRASASPSTT